MSANQTAYAKAITEYLNEEPLAEVDGYLSTLDLLDALASNGLRLVTDPAGDAPTAYMLEAVRGMSTDADAEGGNDE